MSLEAKNLEVSYDTALVLNGASLRADTGEFVTVVGPNGAGKTTLLRCIAGLIRWERRILRGTKYGDITIKGDVTFDGERIDNLPAYEIARKGLVLCPERGRPFSELTVLENIKLGAYRLKDQKKVNANMDIVYQLFPILKASENQISGTLSGGQRQMLAMGRALMADPKLLCIDEPSVGLAPIIKKELFAHIKEIYNMGISILLVEQDVNAAFKLSRRNYVLSRGKVIAEGTSQELLENETIRKTYLGL